MSESVKSVLQEAVPMRREILAQLARPFLTYWAIAAGGSLLLGLLWKASGAAPAPEILCDGLAAAIWLSGYVFYDAISKLLRREAVGPGNAQALIWRGLNVIVVLTGIGFMLTLGLIGVVLAYDPSAVYLLAKPLDADATAWTVARLVTWILAVSGPPLFLLGVGTLSVCRAIGARFGTLLWFLLGLGLHWSILCHGERYWLLTCGGLARLATRSFTSSDPQLRDHMLAPLHSWITLLWVLGLLAAVASLLVVHRQQIRLEPISTALTIGLAAGFIRLATLSLVWRSQPPLLTPDTPGGLLGTTFAVSAVVWLLLVSSNSAVDLKHSAWGTLLPATVIAALLSTPMITAGTLTQAEALSAAGAWAVLLATFVSLATCVAGVTSGYSGRLRVARPKGAGLVLIGIVVVLLLGTRDSEGRLLPVAAIELLSQTWFRPELRPWGLLIVGAAGAAIALSLAAPRLAALRRRRIRRAAADNIA